jgi:hypothetical protein
VKVEPLGGGEAIDVSVRGLRATEQLWAMDGMLEMDERQAMQVFIRYVQLGLISVDNVNDPDTGKPFELKFTTIKIGERAVQVLNIDTIDALMQYVIPIGNEIASLTKLTTEEKEAIPFTGNSSTPTVIKAATPVAEPSVNATPAPESA